MALVTWSDSTECCYSKMIVLSVIDQMTVSYMFRWHGNDFRTNYSAFLLRKGTKFSQKCASPYLHLFKFVPQPARTSFSDYLAAVVYMGNYHRWRQMSRMLKKLQIRCALLCCGLQGARRPHSVAPRGSATFWLLHDFISRYIGQHNKENQILFVNDKLQDAADEMKIRPYL